MEVQLVDLCEARAVLASCELRAEQREAESSVMPATCRSFEPQMSDEANWQLGLRPHLVMSIFVKPKLKALKECLAAKDWPGVEKNAR